MTIGLTLRFIMTAGHSLNPLLHKLFLYALEFFPCILWTYSNYASIVRP